MPQRRGEHEIAANSAMCFAVIAADALRQHVVVPKKFHWRKIKLIPLAKADGCAQSNGSKAVLRLTAQCLNGPGAVRLNFTLYRKASNWRGTCTVTPQRRPSERIQFSVGYQDGRLIATPL